MRARLPHIAAASLMCALAASVQAHAQPQQQEPQQPQQARRPFRGLFGGDASTTGSGQNLTATGSLVAGYDDNVLGDQGGGQSRSALQQSGVYSGLQGGLLYSMQTEALTLSLDGGTSARYYPDLQDLIGLDYRAGASLGWRIGRTTVHAAESFNYAPNFSLQFVPPMTPLVPDALPLPALDLGGADYQVATRVLLRSQTNVGIVTQVGKSSSLGFSYSYGYAGSQEGEGGPLMRSQSASGRFEQQLTRYAGVRLGYGYREVRTSLSPEITSSHDIDVGINYGRPLSISRRTTLTFGTGSSVVANHDRTLFRLSGAANLEHEMGRTWTARLGYQRGLRFLDGFADPTYGDSVSATAAGHVSRRVDLSFSAAYSSGQIGLTAAGSSFGMYVGNAKLQFALSRFLAAYVQGLYYHYDFGDGVRLPSGVSNALDRQGVRIGLTSSVPLL